jgi:hypothetical protein
MALDIKRKAELSLVALLGESLSDLTFYPSKGGTDDGGTSKPVPPFGVIWIDDAEKTHSDQKCYILNGTIVWISRAGIPKGPDISEHSDDVRLVYDAISNIGSGTDVDRSLIVHGIDVGKVNEFSDEARQAWGDTISFTMGVSETD